MKVVLVTGTTGSDRRGYLKEVMALCQERQHAIEIVEDWEEMVAAAKEDGHTLDQETVLNMDTIRDLRLRAFQRIIERVEECRREGEPPQTVVILSHAKFYWGGGIVEGFPLEMLADLKPDLFVTIIDDLSRVRANLLKEPRLHRIDEVEILLWREQEIGATADMARSSRRPHYIVARRHPPDTLLGLVLGDQKRIYASFPMTHVKPDQRAEAAQLIEELRRDFVVFDPSCIEDMTFLSQLTEPLEREEEANIMRVIGQQTVARDYRLIEQSELVVVYYPKVAHTEAQPGGTFYIPLSAGVICEMVHGHRKGKRVYAIWLPDTEPSPFFTYHCKAWFRSANELLSHLRDQEAPAPAAVDRQP